MPEIEDYNLSTNSMDDILKELDKEKTRIIISKDIRRFRKVATVVKGLQGRPDIGTITKEMKTKIGTGGTYKDGQIILQGDHRDYVKNFLLKKGYEEGSIEVI
ncbi:MAG TPA: stress response translation initiation inhibitor YciH [Nitrososphaeraceae archaeon]|nr:stress response translation initiation inhibitor YciH [Nitrososphaeraceae archaeon]